MLDRAIANLTPRPRQRLLDWSRANVQTDAGRPYDHNAYPHIGAPGGPMDAFDCPQYLTIWLQWASRLGKSFFGQCAVMKSAACDPCPMMFASSDQKLGVEVTARTYRMLERCPPLRDQLRPPNRRKQDCVELAACRIYVSWARSVSTLADKAVRVGHANEIDKWEHQSTSTEADPLKLFTDRFKEFPSHKKIIESTPALRHSSRVERGRLASTNCEYWVPCPHCSRYQTLSMGDGEKPGGIVWKKNEAGKSDKDMARATARYICRHCEAEILDQHRGPMMRAGVWIPEGCGCDDEKARDAVRDQVGRPNSFAGFQACGWGTQTPLRDGRDAGYRLSSLYALSLTWGDIAAEFVDSKRNAQNLRNFINQWLAETWEVRESQMTWQQLGQRLIIDLKRYIVPLDCQLLTCGCDIQSDHIVYVVDAWGEGRRSHTVDYGTCETLDELYSRVISRSWQTEDGRQILVALTLMDSGYHPKDVYQFCRECARKNHKVWPCKGSSTSLNAPYRESRLGEDTLQPGAPIIHVDTLTTQDWISHQLTLSHKENDSAATLFHGSLAEHEDFLNQLTNEACVQKLTPQNITKEVWERIDENTPNDTRDCRRYAFAAMLRLTKGAEIRRPVAAARKRDNERQPPRGVQFLERPGGWLRR
jgi:phage terminase large subunit GpA-like protein